MGVGIRLSLLAEHIVYLLEIERHHIRGTDFLILGRMLLRPCKEGIIAVIGRFRLGSRLGDYTVVLGRKLPELAGNGLSVLVDVKERSLLAVLTVLVYDLIVPHGTFDLHTALEKSLLEGEVEIAGSGYTGDAEDGIVRDELFGGQLLHIPSEFGILALGYELGHLFTRKVPFGLNDGFSHDTQSSKQYK